jgi:dUTP pyrophosphatase
MTADGASTNAIVFEALYDDVAVPDRATAHSAGYDLHVYLRRREVRVRTAGGEEELRFAGNDGDSGVVLSPGEIGLFPLGFKARLPPGFEAQVRMRSSWAYAKGLWLPNAPGTIDADYPDEWMVMLKAGGQGAVRISHGDRIAQAVLSRFEVVPWVPGSVVPVGDRTGGFGSTG